MIGKDKNNLTGIFRLYAKWGQNSWLFTLICIGNEVLRQIVRLIRETLRPSKAISRSLSGKTAD